MEDLIRLYQFRCDQCQEQIAFSHIIHKCRNCKINLCSKCYRALNGYCAWCCNQNPIERNWQKKSAVCVFLLVPLVYLLIPMPQSLIYLHMVFGKPVYFVPLIIIFVILLILVIGLSLKMKIRKKAKTLSKLG